MIAAIISISVFVFVCWFILFFAECVEGVVSDKISDDTLSKTQRIILGILCGPVGWFCLLSTRL